MDIMPKTILFITTLIYFELKRTFLLYANDPQFYTAHCSSHADFMKLAKTNNSIAFIIECVL